MKDLDKILNRYARHANNGNTRQMNKARADLIDYMRRFIEWETDTPDKSDVPLPDWIRQKTIFGDPSHEAFIYKMGYEDGFWSARQSFAAEIREALQDP